MIENEYSGYQEALERIQEAKSNGQTSLSLAGLSLTTYHILRTLFNYQTINNFQYVDTF